MEVTQILLSSHRAGTNLPLQYPRRSWRLTDIHSFDKSSVSIVTNLSGTNHFLFCRRFSTVTFHIQYGIKIQDKIQPLSVKTKSVLRRKFAFEFKFIGIDSYSLYGHYEPTHKICKDPVSF